MRLLRATPLVALLMLLCAMEIRGHGRLRVPPSRGSMWRDGFNNPINYNDNELFCGGAWVNVFQSDPDTVKKTYIALVYFDAFSSNIMWCHLLSEGRRSWIDSLACVVPKRRGQHNLLYYISIKHDVVAMIIILPKCFYVSRDYQHI